MCTSYVPMVCVVFCCGSHARGGAARPCVAREGDSRARLPRHALGRGAEEEEITVCIGSPVAVENNEMKKRPDFGLPDFLLQAQRSLGGGVSRYVGLVYDERDGCHDRWNENELRCLFSHTEG